MASEATIARDLRDARFRDALQRIPPAIDPAMMQTAQSAVDRDIDSLRQAKAEQGALGAKYESPRTRNLAESLRSLRRDSRVKNAQGYLAREATNKAYTQMVNSWQSSLLAPSMAFEIFISPWVFLTLFFMRVMASVVPVRLKGVNIIPPYTLKGGGIGVLISHLGGALLILVVLTIIFILIALVAMFLEQPIWEQLKTVINLGETGLQVLYDIVTS